MAIDSLEDVSVSIVEINQIVIIAKMTIEQQQTKISTLEAENADLRAENAELEQQLHCFANTDNPLLPTE